MYAAAAKILQLVLWQAILICCLYDALQHPKRMQGARQEIHFVENSCT